MIANPAAPRCLNYSHVLKSLIKRVSPVFVVLLSAIHVIVLGKMILGNYYKSQLNSISSGFELEDSGI